MLASRSSFRFGAKLKSHSTGVTHRPQAARVFFHSSPFSLEEKKPKKESRSKTPKNPTIKAETQSTEAKEAKKKSKAKPANFDEIADIPDVAPINPATIERVDSMTEEEKAQQKALLLVLGIRNGEPVVCWDEVGDMAIKRWYKDVTIHHVPENDKWVVRLDDRTIVTRSNKVLFLPTEEAAMLIASDWDVQDEFISWTTLPFMMQAAKAVDDEHTWGEYFHDEFKEYMESDHLCYRDLKTSQMFQRQQALYNPILSWFNDTTGLTLNTTHGISQEHPKHTIDSMVVFCLNLPPPVFLQFMSFVGTTKSVLLALAAWHGIKSTPELLHCLRLEEDTQESQHGTIEGGHDYQRALDDVAFRCGSLGLYTNGIPPLSKKSLQELGDPVTFLEDREIGKLTKEMNTCTQFIDLAKRRKQDMVEAGTYKEVDELFFADTDVVWTDKIKECEEKIAIIQTRREARLKSQQTKKE